MFGVVVSSRKHFSLFLLQANNSWITNVTGDKQLSLKSINKSMLENWSNRKLHDLAINLYAQLNDVSTRVLREEKF